MQRSGNYQRLPRRDDGSDNDAGARIGASDFPSAATESNQRSLQHGSSFWAMDAPALESHKETPLSGRDHRDSTVSRRRRSHSGSYTPSTTNKSTGRRSSSHRRRRGSHLDNEEINSRRKKHRTPSSPNRVHGGENTDDDFDDSSKGRKDDQGERGRVERCVVARGLLSNIVGVRFRRLNNPLLWFGLNLTITIGLVWWIAYRYTCE